jgi:Holliday junction DNA helicase RuvB
MSDILNQNNFLTNNELTSPQVQNVDKDYEVKLRPANFSEYIGQKRIVDNILIMSESAKKRDTSMDHVLFSGPPGLGKTSLALLLSQSTGAHLHVISAPAIERKGDLAALLSNLKPRDILFIDEIHRLHITIEELLYSAMEDFRLDILIGAGAAARTMEVKLNPFTLIGATTRSGLMSNPMRDRFHAHFNFDFYSPAELASIIHINAKKIKINLLPEALDLISMCGRGTPRIANRILRRVRDFSLIHDIQEVNQEIIEKALQLLDIDFLGLDAMDRKILKTIKDYYQNGPVGIDALSATLGEDKQTIEDVYEPYLLKEGLLIRTPRGRILSEKSINYLEKNLL